MKVRSGKRCQIPWQRPPPSGPLKLQVQDKETGSFLHGNNTERGTQVKDFSRWKEIRSKPP